MALRNIQILLKERLPERAAATGRYLLDGLGTLRRHPWVGDVRGKGLLAGVELVKDRERKEPLLAPQVHGVVDSCLEKGVIVGRSVGGRQYSNTITLAPPLVLTRAEVDRIVDVLDQACAWLGGAPLERSLDARRA